MKKMLALMALTLSFQAFAHPYYQCEISGITFEGEELTGSLNFFYNVGFDFDNPDSVAYPVTGSSLQFGEQSVLAQEVSEVAIERLNVARVEGRALYNLTFQIDSLRVGDSDFVLTGIPSGQATNFAEFANVVFETRARCKESY